MAYAPTLSPNGMTAYREQLDQQRESLGPRPTGLGSGHDWFVIDWNEQRLAVLDQDVQAMIRTHARGRRVAGWLQDTAEAFAEIGRFDLAIEWAHDATYLGRDHQSMTACDYWCRLLAEHRPEELFDARLQVFLRWPTRGTASGLLEAAGDRWDTDELEAQQALASRPWEAVAFSLLTLQDVTLARNQAHDLDLNDARLWDELIKAYVKTDPAAVIPVLQRRVTELLVNADARNYKAGARNLKKMRRLAKGTQADMPITSSLTCDTRTGTGRGCNWNSTRRVFPELLTVLAGPTR